MTRVYTRSTLDVMATVIKATCVMCYENCHLTPRDVEMVVESNSWGALVYYEFTCPKCETQNSRVAESAVVFLLREAGVRTRPVPVKAHYPETKSARTYLPLTMDDVLDFGTALWVAADPVDEARSRP